MKKILASTALILLIISGYAQETLCLVNGDSVQIKLQEVGLDEIRYTLYNYENQAVIHTPIHMVAMIRYGNGYRQVFDADAVAQFFRRPAPVSAVGAVAESNTLPPTPTPPSAEAVRLKLGGPRIGVTYVASGVAAEYLETINVPPVLSQFGWQFEMRFFETAKGQQGMLEIVPMFGGLEQGRFIPSLSSMVALRGANGLEFGLGPQFYPRVRKYSTSTPTNPYYERILGAAVVFAIGKNFPVGDINFPVNLALVPAIDGFRASLVVGFNASNPNRR